MSKNMIMKILKMIFAAINQLSLKSYDFCVVVL